MRPDPDRVLRGIAATLMGQLGPDCRTPFGQATAGTAATLALWLAAEFDGMAERLYEENRQIVRLAEDGVAVLPPGALRDALGRAPEELDVPNIRVSTLLAVNDRLRGLLVQLHEAVEDIGGPAARVLEERIWDELRESTRRRHVDLSRG